MRERERERGEREREREREKRERTDGEQDKRISSLIPQVEIRTILFVREVP